LKKKYPLLLILLLVGCSQAVSKEEFIAATTQSEATIQRSTKVPATSIPATPTLTPTQPSVPDPILNATETPTEETKIPGLNSFGLSNLAAQERGGVIVEIVWLWVGDKQLLEQDTFENIIINSNMFVDKPVAAWVIFNITNNSGKEIHLHPRRGTVIVNDEQIDLSEYKSYTSVNDKFDGSYSPDEKIIGGGVWFGIQHSKVSEINQMIFTMHGPHFPDDDYYAEGYNFALDLSDHVNQEFPDCLK
jgi:hypothetical protein